MKRNFKSHAEEEEDLIEDLVLEKKADKIEIPIKSMAVCEVFNQPHIV